MPPVLSSMLAVLVFNIVKLIVPGNLGRIIFAGILLGYVGYEMKSHHNKHHYRNGNLGFGITTKIWDYVYGTNFVIKE
jgi:4-hydroxysphinganine ceramide fatty acyl 2-hydroxylase